ncbi:MAG: glycoside hydrolase family 25 protein, partial [Lachnospiraceae bacterium]|nr:glycoside hydrolase family 25 protein [Lachnospiraceae bacterium]
TLFLVVMMFFMITVVVAMMNWELIEEKLGLGGRTEETIVSVEEPVTEDKQIGNDLQAFMRDETFFDSETHYKSIETYSGKAVSVVMSSVAKDLRIMIVDSSGKLVSGFPFTVSIQGLGEYTDTDRDGVIYIDKLRAGEYGVSLNEAEGYRVPNTVMTIKVKQEIEYRVLDDIEYLMLTEDDIDVEKEDTEVKEARQEADGTENTEFAASGENVKKGIDVSKWNETIDWEAVKEDGVEFAIIRCGYRGSLSGSLILDPMYEQNIRGAIDADIPVGVYFFTQSDNEVEAVEEASMVISLIRQYDVDYPVFLDSESAGGNGRADDLNAEDRTRIHKAFLETIANAGYATGIYASANWLNERVDMTELSDYHTWLAEYAEVPSYDGYYHMWQYTSKGSIDGISTNVDLNLCYMNIDTSIDHSMGAGGYTGVVNGDTGNVPTGGRADY